MLVREIMTSPAITVSPSTPIHRALAILDERSITALPVVDGAGRPVGVLGEADVLREALPPDPRRHMDLQMPHPAAPGRVDEVMSRHPVTVEPESDVADAVELMTSTGVKSLPVVEHGRVVGVVSRRDVVHVLARPDDAVQVEVGELFRELGRDWLVTVHDGGVEVEGPETAAEIRLAEVVAATVPGVSRVFFPTRPDQPTRSTL